MKSQFKISDLSIQVIYNFEQINISDWNKLLRANPGSSVFQSPFAYRIFKGVKGHTPFVIAVYKNDILFGIISGAIQKFTRLLPRIFSARVLIQGGPVVLEDDHEITDILLHAVKKEFKNKAALTEIRNHQQTVNPEIFNENLYQYEKHLNFIFDLNLSEEILWKNLNYNRQKQIRKSRKQGVKVIQGTDRELLENCYPIIEAVYRRIGLPYPEIELFWNCLHNDPEGEKFIIFAGLHEDRIIGTRFVLCSYDTVYDWYAGAADNSNHLHPNCILPWEVILWAKNNGYSYFDFGGAGNPSIPYPVRDFKKKFGGELVEYGRWIVYNRKHLSGLFRLGTKIIRILKKTN